MQLVCEKVALQETRRYTAPHRVSLPRIERV